jgi:hypothetical protein
MVMLIFSWYFFNLDCLSSSAQLGCAMQNNSQKREPAVVLDYYYNNTCFVLLLEKLLEKDLNLSSSTLPSLPQQQCDTLCYTPPAPLSAFLFRCPAHMADCFSYLPSCIAASSGHCWWTRRKQPLPRHCPNE